MDLVTAVELAKQHNNEGIAYLYEQTYQKNYYVALKYMTNEETAQDVLQDAYIKAFSNIDKLENSEKFENWMARIVATTALDELRKKKPTLFSDTENEEGQTIEDTFEDDRVEIRPEVVMDKKETSRLVQEMMADLSDEQRVCITMFYMEEMSVKDIANTLEVSENTVKSRLNYGRQKIKDKVIALEKQGTKLYSLAPLPFFVWIIKAEMAKTTVAVPTFTAIVSGTVSAATGTTGVSATGGTAATAGGITAGEAAKVAVGITTKKIIAGVVATAVIGGTATGLVIHGKNNGEKEPENVEETTSYNNPDEENGPQLSEYNSSITEPCKVAIYENKAYYALHEKDIDREVIYEYDLDTEEKKAVYTSPEETYMDFGTMVAKDGYLYCAVNPQDRGEDDWVDGAAYIYRYDLESFTEERLCEGWDIFMVDGNTYCTVFDPDTDYLPYWVASVDLDSLEVNRLAVLRFNVEDYGYSEPDFNDSVYYFSYNNQLCLCKKVFDINAEEYVVCESYVLDGERLDTNEIKLPDYKKRINAITSALQEMFGLENCSGIHYMADDYICLDYCPNGRHVEGYYIISPDGKVSLLN